ncbi:MAG: hypothetical protein EKK61_02875 [Rickettsiales bacterium]|nr:MAG: hypothetical protein EKK61_02875 [Rickettsiales bacterium]
MKRTTNEEINIYDFPNIQCGFITININYLAMQICAAKNFTYDQELKFTDSLYQIYYELVNIKRYNLDSSTVNQEINKKLYDSFAELIKHLKSKIKSNLIQDRSELITKLNDLNKEISNCAIQIDNTHSSKINDCLKNDSTKMPKLNSEEAFLTTSDENEQINEVSEQTDEILLQGTIDDNNEETNTHNFPNIELGLITLNVDDLVNKMREFYIQHSQSKTFIDQGNTTTTETTYTSPEIIIFNQNIVNFLNLIYNQLLSIQISDFELYYDELELALDHQTKNNINNLFYNIQIKHIPYTSSALLIFVHTLSAQVISEIRYNSIQDRSELIKQLNDLNTNSSIFKKQIDQFLYTAHCWIEKVKEAPPVIIYSPNDYKYEDTDSQKNTDPASMFLAGDSESDSDEDNF